VVLLKLKDDLNELRKQILELQATEIIGLCKEPEKRKLCGRAKDSRILYKDSFGVAKA
jgi:hypothetical protein